MRPGRLTALAASLIAVALLVAVGSAAQAQPAWKPVLHVAGIVDVVGPRADGGLLISATTGLFLYHPGSGAEPFAAGPGGYKASTGEPYVALVPARRKQPGANCSFHRDDVYALDADTTPGVVRITAQGKAVRVRDLPAGTFPSGIALDLTGRFGYRLLVAAVFRSKTTIYAIGCLGQIATVVRDAPRVEGGMAVAPRAFGAYGGDLIAADENSGTIYAFSPDGRVRVVARPHLPAGSDIGVESLGFVPAPAARLGGAYMADLGAPQSPTKGSDSLLSLSGSVLSQARLTAGELVAVTEAGARTVVVACAARCTTRRIADGPAGTHGEGHVTFLPG
jgi:hypothetical protein